MAKGTGPWELVLPPSWLEKARSDEGLVHLLRLGKVATCLCFVMQAVMASLLPRAGKGHYGSRLLDLANHKKEEADKFLGACEEVFGAYLAHEYKAQLGVKLDQDAGNEWAEQ